MTPDHPEEPHERQTTDSPSEAQEPTVRERERTPHIWLVEDSESDAEEYKFFLERSGQLQVDLGEVYPQIEDYASVPLDDSVSAVIVDQFLAENTGVAYEGLDVAEYLRVIAPALPVFVLTNFAGELEEQAGAVDLVITKGNMRKHSETYIARILRRIGQYREALGEQQLRLQELLDLELSEDLDATEERELTELRKGIERPSDITLLRSGQRKDLEIEHNEERTRTLEALLQEMRTISDRLNS
jgi:hypothetical protein